MEVIPSRQDENHVLEIQIGIHLWLVQVLVCLSEADYFNQVERSN